MRTLFVAAGGGGDAVGILLARRLLDPIGEGPALISSCAWERLRIDPVPGPRPVRGFSGLGDVGGRAVEILATTDTIPPGRSMLPRLAADTGARIFLHDFEGGAVGVAGQLQHVAQSLEARRLMVVDVGGDVVATGDEEALLSPLADSLTLAGALQSGLPVMLAVIGPGADAELPEKHVLNRIETLRGRLLGHVSPSDVDRLGSLFAWHPTEASSLVAAAAMGERGSVWMRRGGPLTPLTAVASGVWNVDPDPAGLPLVAALMQTTTFTEAERIVERLSVNEMTFERAKAAGIGISQQRSPRFQRPPDGATHVTRRRLAEIGAPASVDNGPLPRV